MERRSRLITHEELIEALDYDPETGWFVWKTNRRGLKDAKGKRAGTVHWNLYRLVCINGKDYREHRLAWFYVHKEWLKELDHINRVRDDNRIANLRPATRSQNNANRPYKNSFGLRGVAKVANTWFAQINIHGKHIYLGSYPSAELAHEAYCRAARAQWGEFANEGLGS